jgi:hypothetical protein
VEGTNADKGADDVVVGGVQSLTSVGDGSNLRGLVSTKGPVANVTVPASLMYAGPASTTNTSSPADTAFAATPRNRAPVSAATSPDASG